VTDAAAGIRLDRVSKSFGDVVAVDDVSLEIASGEFFSVLGPSGSGKTTVLRVIAGFERADSGAVWLGGTDVTGVPAFERDVNTVFQDYALFPHMSVLENVEFGLRVKGVAKSDRKNRAVASLEMVQMSNLAARKPSQLSGGQRQRVALARAIVNEPRVLLLDEPLGALDLKLREDMQVELKDLQRRLGITFVYVTHDQGEALSMSDRVAVFNNGRIEQLGTPLEVYDQPATPFVADFVGSVNVFTGDEATQLVGRPGTFAIRPENIHLRGTGTGRATARVEECQFLGAFSKVIACLDSGTIVTVAGSSRDLHGLRLGESVTLWWDDSSVVSLGDRAI
jgi:putative spermidine/putrescine transport system ATP-binding protein